MDYKALSREILSLAGGNENIDSFTHCMTRLRLNVNDPDKVDVAAIKQLDGVLGVVPGDQVQIVVGPGHSDRLDAAFAEVSNASHVDFDDDEGTTIATLHIEGDPLRPEVAFLLQLDVNAPVIIHGPGGEYIGTIHPM